MNVWLDLDRLAAGLSMDKGELTRRWGAHFGGPARESRVHLFHLLLETQGGFHTLLTASMSHPVIS